MLFRYPELVKPSPPEGLTRLHGPCMLLRMRTTLNLRDDLLAEAQRLTGVSEKTALLHAGLEALIARESARRLAALGGTARGLKVPRRRRLPKTQRAR